MSDLAQFTFNGEDPRPGEAYLYLVEIINSGVKVGISTQPERRIKQHRRDANAFGRGIGQVWVSDAPHQNARENEQTVRGSSRREYLNRTFADCLAQVETLSLVRAPIEDPLDHPFNKFLSALQPGFGDYLARERTK